MNRLLAARTRLLAGVALGWLVAGAADVSSGGFTLAWWRDGPPYVRRAPEWKPEHAVLSLQSGRIGFMLDTVTLRALHAGTFDAPVSKADVLAGDGAPLRNLPSPLLDLRISAGGRTWRCVGRDPRHTDDLHFPVRIIESGRALQHVVIDDLRFEDEHRQRWPGAGSLEVALWPDRLVLTAAVKGAGGGNLTLQFGEMHATAPLAGPASLTLFGPDTAITAPAIADDGGTAAWDPVRGAWRLNLRVGPWPRPTPGGYPLADPDRLDRWRFTLRNPTDQPLAIPLLFCPEPMRGITGVSAILGEADGIPTGLPVQLSKNWHQRAETSALPEQGTWLHAAAHLVLPPRSEKTLQFALAYARWGGLPAASHAQLSLVGWGHNQFWDQVAVGSFGESICFEPGRVQRRCFITDIRPLMTLGKSREPGGWANNGGGGDFLLWIDPAGKWQGWTGTRTDYRSPGPCLTDVEYHEQTAGGEIRSRVRVQVPRGDDHLRVLFRIRHEVRAPVRWQRLAFFQLGADHYNFTPARRVARGDLRGLHEEWTPRGPRLSYDREGLPLRGEQPWVSVHDIDHAALRPGNAAASRGLIIRSWAGRLGGQPAPLPHLSTLRTEIAGGVLTTGLELVPPPGVTELRPGDFVEAELELVMFPALAADYWGKHRAFQAALARAADTWHLVHAEAAGNALRVRASHGTTESHYPVRVRAAADGRADFTFDGGLGAVPLTVAGVGAPRGFALRVDGRTIDQAVHGHDFWQADVEPATGTWALTFNVPLEPGPHRVEWTGAPAGTATPEPGPRPASPVLTR